MRIAEFVRIILGSSWDKIDICNRVAVHQRDRDTIGHGQGGVATALCVVPGSSPRILGDWRGQRCPSKEDADNDEARI